MKKNSSEDEEEDVVLSPNQIMLERARHSLAAQAASALLVKETEKQANINNNNINNSKDKNNNGQVEGEGEGEGSDDIPPPLNPREHVIIQRQEYTPMTSVVDAVVSEKIWSMKVWFLES